MTAVNHALTGALLGLATGSPLVAIPMALASHFVLDTLPHFGMDPLDNGWLRSPPFKIMLIVDAALCLALVTVLWTHQPTHWLLAAVCAFLATSPDLLWIGKFRRALAHDKSNQLRGFLKFAAQIQWFQRPIGAIVEVAWLFGMLVLLKPFLV